MSTGAVIGIIIVVIVVVAAVVVASVELRRARLRRQFGPEYDRLSQQLGSRKKADAELAERQRRVGRGERRRTHAATTAENTDDRPLASRHRESKPRRVRIRGGANGSPRKA